VEKAPAGLLPWFRVPNRRSRDLRIVFGHWSALGFYDADNVLNLDTGCVWGSRLTAVRLDQPMTPQWVPCQSSGLKPDG
jgi:bis(5'-nucleosyl)-tetraphosphatase (symmetrical)